MAVKGAAPAAFLSLSLPTDWSVKSRSPPLSPLPLDPRIVLDGPRPSGWRAIRKLARMHAPSSCVLMRHVLRAMVEAAADG
jgi:hypothetical protein